MAPGPDYRLNAQEHPIQSSVTSGESLKKCSIGRNKSPYGATRMRRYDHKYFLAINRVASQAYGNDPKRLPNTSTAPKRCL